MCLLLVEQYSSHPRQCRVCTAPDQLRSRAHASQFSNFCAACSVSEDCESIPLAFKKVRKAVAIQCLFVAECMLLRTLSDPLMLSSVIDSAISATLSTRRPCQNTRTGRRSSGIPVSQQHGSFPAPPFVNGVPPVPHGRRIGVTSACGCSWGGGISIWWRQLTSSDTGPT